MTQCTFLLSYYFLLYTLLGLPFIVREQWWGPLACPVCRQGSVNGGGADAPAVPRGCGKTQALEGPLISCASCPVTLLYVCALLKRTSKNALNTLLGSLMTGSARKWQVAIIYNEGWCRGHPWLPRTLPAAILMETEFIILCPPQVVPLGADV